jgi:hypothetical protein
MDHFPSVSGQHSAEWRTVLASIQSYANSVFTGQPGGLLGFILSPADYLAEYQHPFIPYQHPGAAPAANAAQGA